MERVGDRVARAGYRRDRGGLVAYLFTPEAWTTPAYTVFVMAAGAMVVASLSGALTARSPLIGIPFRAAVVYLLIVRPVLGVAARREARHASSVPD